MKNYLIPSLFNTTPSIGDFFTDDFFTFRPQTSQLFNVSEDGESYLIEVSSPGFNKEDFNIELDNTNLVISGELKEENEDLNYQKREFKYSSFKRRFSLPQMVNRDKINAEYKNGILRVKVPKVEKEQTKAIRTIAIT